MEFQTPKNGSATTTTKNLQNPNNGEPTTSHDHTISYEDFDSACSTPYVSAPSSPGRAPPIAGGGGGFFYSAPTSPMHFLLSASSLTPTSSIPREDLEEFDFSAGWYSTTRPMSSADELFLNGKIRPQKLAPLLDVEEGRSEEEEYSDDSGGKIVRGRREMKSRNRSLRRIRSMSPLRTTSESFPKNEEKINGASVREEDATASGSSSRSSSVGRNSKRWVSLKDFLYRSKSEGRNNGRHKYFWSSLSFSPVKEKDKKTAAAPLPAASSDRGKSAETGEGENVVKREPRSKAATAAGKRMGLSAHELHYTENRAQAEEMRRRTFLPYRQGLLGCLGFNSKGYGAMNGFARALNPVS